MHGRLLMHAYNGVTMTRPALGFNRSKVSNRDLRPIEVKDQGAHSRGRKTTKSLFLGC